jgi:hypothetical protein
MSILSKCRFCLEEDQSNRMVIPCACVETCAFVHTKCLTQWLQYTDRCNVCNARYRLPTGILSITRIISSNINDILLDSIILIIFVVTYLLFSYNSILNVQNVSINVLTKVMTYTNITFGLLVIIYAIEDLIEKL